MTCPCYPHTPHRATSHKVQPGATPELAQPLAVTSEDMIGTSRVREKERERVRVKAGSESQPGANNPTQRARTWHAACNASA